MTAAVAIVLLIVLTCLSMLLPRVLRILRKPNHHGTDLVSAVAELEQASRRNEQSTWDLQRELSDISGGVRRRQGG